MAQIRETELDVGALSRALWRRAWLLILLALAAAVATYAALSRVEPLYTADTRILIEERESPLTRPREQSQAPASSFDESAILSQVEVVRSREVADAVIDKLDLTRRPEFDPARRPSLVGSLMVMLGLDESPVESSIRQRIMESYYERLRVYPVQKSRVIGIEFQAPDPELAAEVANAIAATFVAMQQVGQRESAAAATQWLEQEIERLRGRVAEAEQAISEYRASKGLFDVDRRNDTPVGNLSTQQLSDLNAELGRARAARAEAESRARLVQSLIAEGATLDASQEVLASQLIQRLRERQVALRAQIAELSTTLLPAHPRIRALEGQLANLDGQIRQEANKVLASLNTAARVAAAREESLIMSLNQAKSVVSQSNDEEIELRALEREAASQRDLLESFLARYREALARTDSDYLPADARIISRAVAPREPSYPKKAMMAVAAAIAAFLIGAALLLMREFTTGRAYRLLDYGGAPGPLRPSAATDLVVTPVAERARDGAIVLLPEAVPAPSAAAAAEAALAAPVVLAENAAGDRAGIVVADAQTELDPAGTVELAEIIASPAVRLALFAGAVGGEGAGDIAFATAREAAGDNLRLVLIDVGAPPSEALGGYEQPGLGDLLSGEAAFGEVITREEGSRVHVIPMGAIGTNPPLQRLQLVIGALTHTYDKVIIVADKLADWPDEHVKPDIAAIVCGPETTEDMRVGAYEAALERGAQSAIIVRYSVDAGSGVKASAAA